MNIIDEVVIVLIYNNLVMKQCMKCGTANADNAYFCNNCGAPLQSGQNNGMYGNFGQRYARTSSPSSGQTGNVSFSDAIRICLKEKYLCLSGRAGRAEYWYFILFSVIIGFAAVFAGAFIGTVLSGGDEEVGLGLAVILMVIVSLGLACPGVSVLVRRLHDTGRSGWWYFLCLIPWIGSIVLLIFVCLNSQEGDNEYGPYIR